MLSFIRKLFGKKDAKAYEDFYVPNNIEQIGKLYPVIETLANNKASGEIKRFMLENNKLRVGQAMFRNNDNEVWIHLGKDYFKNTIKV